MTTVDMRGNIEDNGYVDRKVGCFNCGWKGKAHEVESIDDFEERVEAGEVMPCGECPECGVVVKFTDVGSRYEAKERLAASLKSYVSDDEAEEFFQMHKRGASDAELEAWRKPFLRLVAERIMDDLE